MREEMDYAKRCERAMKSPLVEGRVILVQGVPFVRATQEPVSVVLGDVLCSDGLPLIPEELETTTGLTLDDLRAALEFVCTLVGPYPSLREEGIAPDLPALPHPRPGHICTCPLCVPGKYDHTAHLPRTKGE